MIKWKELTGAVSASFNERSRRGPKHNPIANVIIASTAIGLSLFAGPFLTAFKGKFGVPMAFTAGAILLLYEGAQTVRDVIRKHAENKTLQQLQSQRLQEVQREQSPKKSKLQKLMTKPSS